MKDIGKKRRKRQSKASIEEDRKRDIRRYADT